MLHQRHECCPNVRLGGSNMAPPSSSVFVPQDAALSAFEGFVRVAGDEYKLKISGVRYAAAQQPTARLQPRRMLFDSAHIEAEPPLAKLLAPHEPLLKVRLMQASSLDAFICELEELVAVSASPSSSIATQRQALPDASYYNRLMEELEAVGWSRLVQLSEDMRTIELQTQDGNGRVHSVRVALTPAYPLVTPMCTVDAPAAFRLDWPSSTSVDTRHRRPSTNTASTTVKPSLQLIIAQFESFLEEYQGFWNVLEEIDAACCVLEPQHPTRSTGRRRIAVQRHVSIQVEINPSSPRGICELKFFGSEASVAPLRERWSDRVFEWEEHRSVPQNLEMLLDVELPTPKATQADEFALECGICYCYRLDTADEAVTADSTQSTIPDRLCENTKCHRPFHERCLFEWLKALPTARQSFSTVFGECPYCREAISAKFV